MFTPAVGERVRFVDESEGVDAEGVVETLRTQETRIGRIPVKCAVVRWDYSGRTSTVLVESLSKPEPR